MKTLKLLFQESDMRFSIYGSVWNLYTTTFYTIKK